MRTKPITWDPLFKAGTQRDRILEILEYIDSSISQTFTTPDLMYGKAGISIFHLYYYFLRSDKKSLDRATELMEQSINLIAELPNTDLGMGKGVSGILWGLNHFVEMGIFENNPDLVEPDFFLDLYTQTANDISNGEYDYLLGAMGTIFLYLETKRFDDAQKLIRKLISISVRDEKQQPFWYQSPLLNVSGQGKVINLGLAHGIPSILSILSNSVSVDYKNNEITDCIRKSFLWLKNHRLDFGKHGFFYPFSISDNSEPFSSSLRWCYGDLGISISILLVGRRLKDVEIANFGLELAINCASRTLDPSSISDAHICHGTSGIAHIYNRLYNYTGNELFKNAAMYWFDQTITRFSNNLQSGFRAWKGDFGWVEYDGLLEGSSGVGLTLISAISDVEPRWDRCLLLS